MIPTDETEGSRKMCVHISGGDATDPGVGVRNSEGTASLGCNPSASPGRLQGIDNQ